MRRHVRHALRVLATGQILVYGSNGPLPISGSLEPWLGRGLALITNIRVILSEHRCVLVQDLFVSAQKCRKSHLLSYGTGQPAVDHPDCDGLFGR
jgi:hypothetical protein